MREFVIDLNNNPELAQVIADLSKPRKTDKPVDRQPQRTNAIAGERVQPRKALRRGFQPQK